MTNAGLNINSLTGNKGSLIIDKAYIHSLYQVNSGQKLYQDIYSDGGGLYNFTKAITNKGKPGQKFMQYYSFLDSGRGAGAPGLLLQYISYKPTNSNGNWYFSTATGGFFIFAKMTDDYDYLINHDTYSFIELTSNAYFGLLYLNLEKFSATNNFSYSSSSSIINKFHSSISIKNFKGSKKEIDENWKENSSFPYYLLKIKTFYYIKAKFKNYDAQAEFIINFTEPNFHTIHCGETTSQHTEDIEFAYDQSDGSVKMWPPSNSNLMDVEVYELPVKINSVLVSERDSVPNYYN